MITLILGEKVSWVRRFYTMIVVSRIAGGYNFQMIIVVTDLKLLRDCRNVPILLVDMM